MEVILILALHLGLSILSPGHSSINSGSSEIGSQSSYSLHFDPQKFLDHCKCIQLHLKCLTQPERFESTMYKILYIATHKGQMIMVWICSMPYVRNSQYDYEIIRQIKLAENNSKQHNIFFANILQQFLWIYIGIEIILSLKVNTAQCWYWIITLTFFKFFCHC